MAAHGINLDQLKIPRRTFMLQILDARGHWCDWGPIHGSGLNVGRAKGTDNFPGLDTMAVRHLRFTYGSRSSLTVDDLGSLNGVFLRIQGPFDMADGTRFRVGAQLIEFRLPEPFVPVETLVAEDGEKFSCRDLEPLAFLDLIRPNNRVGLRFPVLHPEVTIIGREKSANLVLPGDHTVSSQHAQIRRVDGGFVLEDLNSRNGTYVHLIGSTPVQAGDVLLAGRVLLRVHDPAMG